MGGPLAMRPRPGRALRRLLLSLAALSVPAAAQVIQPVAPPPPGQAAPKLDVPYGPTSPVLIDAMLRLANLGPKDFLIDLGSGDGRINIAAARSHGVRGAGYELDAALVERSRRFARLAGVEDKVTFHTANLFGADLSRASVVAVYLGPVVTPRVAPKLLAELKAGTRIVSHNFGFGAWQPDLTVQPLGTGTSKVLFWWVPAQVAGQWRARFDGAEYRFDLRQTYQEVDGEVAIAAAQAGAQVRVVLRDARLQGETLRFLLQEQRSEGFTFRRFEGRVGRDLIEGHVRVDDPPAEQPMRLERLSRAEPGPAGAWTYTFKAP